MPIDSGPTMWDTPGHALLGWMFIEFPEFTAEWKHHFGDDRNLAAYQLHLAQSPESGDVMPGCGGLRKDRWPDPRRGKGKRGGLRIVYLHVPEVRVIVLADVYDKDEADDLDNKQKKVLTHLVAMLREELKTRFRKDAKQ